MALTGVYGPISKRQAKAVVERALALGIRHFDTAEMYGPHTNEMLVAEALGSMRNRVTIATKFGCYLANDGTILVDSRPESIRRSVVGSLRRLKRETIDVLYQHRVDPAVPIEDVVGTMGNLVTEGKVRELGLCAVDEATWRRANQVRAVSIIQNECSLLRTCSSRGLLKGLAARSGSFVAFSPLARGILAARNPAPSSKRRPADYRSSRPEFRRQILSDLAHRFDPLWQISESRNVPPAVVALGWVLSTAPCVFAIPGARTVEQVSALAQVAEFSLSVGERRALSKCTR